MIFGWENYDFPLLFSMFFKVSIYCFLNVKNVFHCHFHFPLLPSFLLHFIQAPQDFSSSPYFSHLLFHMLFPLFPFLFLLSPVLLPSSPPHLTKPLSRRKQSPMPSWWRMADTFGLCPSCPVSGFFPCNTLLFLLLLVDLHFSMEHVVASRQSDVLRSAFCSHKFLMSRLSGLLPRLFPWSQPDFHSRSNTGAIRSGVKSPLCSPRSSILPLGFNSRAPRKP